MEKPEVGGIGESLLLLFTRVLFEGLLICLFHIDSGLELYLERPRIHAGFGFTPDALLIEVVMIVGGICREIHLWYGFLSK